MDITITINTDNAAFEDNCSGEVQAILTRIAGKIARQSENLDGFNGCAVMDSNGNKVGSVEVSE